MASFQTTAKKLQASKNRGHAWLLTGLADFEMTAVELAGSDFLLYA
jgi:hypothetical protein